jgi:hypothetical protein
MAAVDGRAERIGQPSARSLSPFLGRLFRNRTPAPPPFSSMNSTRPPTPYYVKRSATWLMAIRLEVSDGHKADARPVPPGSSRVGPEQPCTDRKSSSGGSMLKTIDSINFDQNSLTKAASRQRSSALSRRSRAWPRLSAYFDSRITKARRLACAKRRAPPRAFASSCCAARKVQAHPRTSMRGESAQRRRCQRSRIGSTVNWDTVRLLDLLRKRKPPFVLVAVVRELPSRCVLTESGRCRATSLPAASTPMSGRATESYLSLRRKPRARTTFTPCRC